MKEEDTNNVNRLLCCRYTSIACGVRPHKEGSLLKVNDVVAALTIVLDDDEKVQERIRAIIEHLTKQDAF